ncbi:MAG TPA: hypothetical protein VKW04_18870 [Planctomycetota bacterium]|nr:hypothetical protein [Planctomycetota bacterium]
MRWWAGGFAGVQQALAILLAAILMVLSSRSTVESISTLVLAPSSAFGMSSAKSSQAGAMDRKPKPTRQQERNSTGSLLRFQVAIASKPLLAGGSGWDGESLRSTPDCRDWSSGFDGVQATRPDYLRPSEIAPQGQIPPPASPAV